MAKENIKVLQLVESPFGIQVFPITDQGILENAHSEIIVPHRHDHYCCFFVETGHLNFNIDFRNLEIPSPALLVSCPGQVHEFGFAKDLTGWVMAFDAKFVDESARAVIEQSFARVALLDLDLPTKDWFAGHFKLIESALHDRQSSHFQHQLLQALLNAFFYKTVMIFQSREDERILEYSLRSIELVKNFQQLVKEHFSTLKKPRDYASKVNVTVSYLNDTVKSVTGFPSTWFIQQEVFREAQRLLFYTTKSVKEIAFQLGYEDYKYFIRLFSKTIGTSPASFRKSTRS